jgi:hypothetical protein
MVLSGSMKNLFVVSTSDLTPKPDSIHFDSPSQRLLGERLATAVFQQR